MSDTTNNKNTEAIELRKPVVNSDFLKFNNLDELEKYAKIAVASGRCNATSTADAIMLYTQACELGIGFASASNHMHIVNGKAGIDYHIITALLLKAGIEWTIVQNYVPLYKYIDGSGNIFTHDILPSNYAICSSTVKEQTTAAIDSGKHPVYLAKSEKGAALPYDYVTHVHFKRERQRQFSKGIYMQESDGIYCWSDAVNAGLVTAGSNWLKRPKVMLYKQAYTLGARIIGDDLLMGLPEIGELCDVEGKNYIVAEDCQVTVVE